MTLLELVESSIDDETSADNEYEKMAELVDKQDNLNDSEKALILGIIFKINTDEETHQVLLKVIRDILKK
jgi:UDP-glucose 6-dehydrogenase